MGYFSVSLPYTVFIMNLSILHGDMLPLVYGLVMFLGIAVMLVKFLRGHWLSLTVDAVVFYGVFALHGGSMSGGFSAMVAALLAGLFFPLLFKLRKYGD